MSLLQLLVLAVATMAGLAILRVVRVRAGRSPLPEHRTLFLLAVIVGLPVLAGAMTGPTAGALGGAASIPLFAALLGGVAVVMWIVSLLVPHLVPGRSRAVLMLALTGSEGDPDRVPFDPPVTPRIAASVAALDQANGSFPRGPGFAAEVHSDDFRAKWDALDAASRELEGLIVDDHRLGVAVASSAMAASRDARERLDTLRRLASESGQTWASASPVVAAAST